MKFLIILAVSMATMFALNASNIKTITLKKGEVASSKEYLATTAFAEDRICQVAPRFSGFIDNIYANETFKNIQKGETLFDAYSPELISSINEAISIKKYIATLNSDEDTASLENAKRMLDSTVQKLAYLGLTSEQIKSELSKDIASKTVAFKSPCSGTVSEKNVFKGSSFGAGQKLYAISDNSALWLEIKVYENDLQNIRIGQSVEASIIGMDKKIKAKIIKILPEVNMKDRSITARALISNPNRKIAANSFAKAAILSNKQAGIILPKTAVIERGGKMYVFLSQNGKFEPTEINAKKVGSSYIVSDGVGEGDKVADGALFMLDSDAKLQGLY